mgnify:CR=1 FL=1
MILSLGIWFAVTGSSGSLSRLAQISTALLAIPVYIAGLFFGLVLLGLIYLVVKLIQGVPSATQPVLEILEKVQDIAGRISHALAQMVIEPAALLAIFQRKSDPPDQQIKLKD